MYVHRLTFSLDHRDLDALQQLARRHRASVSQLVRDAVTIMLAHPELHAPLLSARVETRYALPTPEQHANAERLFAQLAQVDLAALVASLPAPPPP